MMPCDFGEIGKDKFTTICILLLNKLDALGSWLEAYMAFNFMVYITAARGRLSYDFKILE